MVSQLESFSRSEVEDGTHPLQPQQSLKRKSETAIADGLLSIANASPETNGLSILFSYFVLIIFIVIAIRKVVVLFKIIERLAFILCCFALSNFHLLLLWQRS